MTDEVLLREFDDRGVATLTFNRPDKLNALSEEVMQRLEWTLVSIQVRKELRALVLRGAGGKAFVAGADIEEYRGGQEEAFQEFQERGRSVFDRLEALPIPTVAVVEGYALGGGFEIALCCDLIVCTPQAQFGLPEGRLGLCPGGGGTVRLTRAVGKHVASDLALGAWRIDGRRAHQLGIACECVEQGELEEALDRRVRGLLKVAPLAQERMKDLIRDGVDMQAETAKSVEQRALLKLYRTKDGQEGIDAFLDKREPDFKGE